jgi:preprotein translocase subunit SecF
MGYSLNDTIVIFAFALLVGMIAGTYSTILIASPLRVYGCTWRAARATRSVAGTVEPP